MSSAVTKDETFVRPQIRILPDDVVNQIAAGEVVERPSSVVKELVENSIDAGAREITVSVSNGGKTEIEIVDDGCGMSRSDALLAIERFGTSKIESVHDLLSISTMGFRGEALPSIAAVSKFSIMSRPQGDASGKGIVLNIEGGKLQNADDAALPFGTRIGVRQLFFNVPARRAFLRSENTELGNVKAQMVDFAAAYPHIRFRLVADGKEVFHVSPAADLFERLGQLKLVSNETVLVRGAALDGPIRIQGALTKPAFSVGSSNRLRLVLNGRAVRDRLLLRAVRDGYGNFLKGGRYPSGLLRIELPPEIVDVNVHPQKSEVRFRSPDMVFVAVKKSVEVALLEVAPLEHFLEAQNLDSSVPTTQDQKSYQSSLPAFRERAEFVYQSKLDASAHVAFSEQNVAHEIPSSENQIAGETYRLRFLGQVFELYLIFADEAKLVVIDMHAAHERVTFYKMKKALLEGKSSSQQLAFPESIHIPAENVETLRNILPELEKLGFEIELLGEDQIVVRGVPAAISQSRADFSLPELLRDMVSAFGLHESKRALDRQIDAVISRLACHASVRRGRILGKEEAFALLSELEESEASGFCPHGRPVARTLQASELESLFDR